VAKRIENLIHHITTLCDPGQLGRTKIAKILWLSDVEYFRRSGKTISHSDEYVKDEHGPRHSKLYESLAALKADNRVVERQGLTPVGYRNEYVPVSTVDVSDFSAEEIAIVDRITAKISGLSAKQASDLTHDDLWDAAYFNERMPVAAAAPIAGDVTPDIMNWAESIFNEHCKAC
jgi:hypothetical protein